MTKALPKQLDQSYLLTICVFSNVLVHTGKTQVSLSSVSSDFFILSITKHFGAENLEGLQTILSSHLGAYQLRQNKNMIEFQTILKSYQEGVSALKMWCTMSFFIFFGVHSVCLI